MEKKTTVLSKRHMDESETTKKAAIKAIREVRQKALAEALQTLEEEDLMRIQQNQKLKETIDLQKSEIDRHKHELVRFSNENKRLRQENELTLANNEM